MARKAFLLGNEAIARGLLENGVKVVAGYPGTPSSEIIEALARDAKKYNIHVEWSVNEKAALEVAIGAAWSGVRSAAVMKHVGLNVASDPFLTLAYTGAKGLVLIVCDDPNCHSSQNEQDSRRYAYFAKIPCLDPASPMEAKEMVSYAFNLSEKFDIPVMLRPTTRVSHAKSDIQLGEVMQKEGKAEFKKAPERRVMLPAHARPLLKELNKKQDEIKIELEKSPWNSLLINKDAKLGVIASGISSMYAKEAIAKLQARVSFLKIGTYPVPEHMIRKLLRNVEAILVIEELEPVVEEQIRILLDKNIRIMGKTSKHIPREGELTLDIVENAIARATGKRVRIIEIEQQPLPPRPPVMCAGCPHRAIFYAIREVFGRNSIFPSDIGCYTLGVQLGTVDTTLCMGSSTSLAAGIYFAGEQKPICATIGDSTFLHSGITGLMNAVYNKAKYTLVILDNLTTGMTGHQPHPGIGVTATGDITTRISIEAITRACGVEFVEIIDPYDINNAKQVLTRARDSDGVRVVISRQACVIIARRMGIKRNRYEVSEACIGCRKCIIYGCPAIEFRGGQAYINDMCNGCGVCSQLCPASAIKARVGE
ncbi:MAG: indolepyruvate ferredoxin oxidoreductase subunit alpha [Methanocellales archaeon]